MLFLKTKAQSAWALDLQDTGEAYKEEFLKLTSLF